MPGVLNKSGYSYIVKSKSNRAQIILKLQPREQQTEEQEIALPDSVINTNNSPQGSQRLDPGKNTTHCSVNSFLSTVSAFIFHSQWQDKIKITHSKTYDCKPEKKKAIPRSDSID